MRRKSRQSKGRQSRKSNEVHHRGKTRWQLYQLAEHEEPEGLRMKVEGRECVLTN